MNLAHPACRLGAALAALALLGGCSSIRNLEPWVKPYERQVRELVKE